MNLLFDIITNEGLKPQKKCIKWVNLRDIDEIASYFSRTARTPWYNGISLVNILGTSGMQSGSNRASCFKIGRGRNAKLILSPKIVGHQRPYVSITNFKIKEIWKHHCFPPVVKTLGNMDKEAIEAYTVRNWRVYGVGNKLNVSIHRSRNTWL